MAEPVIASAPGPVLASGRAPGGGRLALGLLATAAILILYGAYYGRLIAASTVVPTFDQAAYMLKTYHIADTVYAHPLQALNPWTYLGEPYANRPPLLMAAAGLVLGPGATPQAIGLVWLGIRLAVLFGALGLAARRVGEAAFLPAAALAIAAAPGSLTLYPNMYMMDQAFEAFGLLAFVWLALDEERHTARSAGLGALGTLLLLLVKPAALVLLFPMYVLLLRRAWRISRAEAQPGAARRMLVRWLWPYAILAAALGLLAVTPLGAAVAQQYALGSRGYWATGKSVLRVAGMIALVAPPWLLGLTALSIIMRGRRQIPLAVPAAAVVLWWFLFNAVLTYTLDARIISGAMPIAVVGALLAVVRSRKLAAAATLAAALVFALAMLATSGVLSTQGRRYAAVLAPLPEAQRPIAEVGLLETARAVKRSINAAAGPGSAPAGRADAAHRLMMLTSDDFVENAAMHLAMRFTGGADGIYVDSHPWGTESFHLEGVFSFEWFLTKERRREPAVNPLRGDVFVPLYALDALIVEPGSPLRDCFEKEWTLPIHQPGGWEDSVTLWRVKRMPTRVELLEALRFIGPKFAGTKGEAAVAAEEAALGAAAGSR